METITKKMKTGIFLFLLFALPIGTMAQATITAYVCGTGQATLVPDFGTYTPSAGDRIVWSEIGGSAVTYTQGTDPSVNHTTPVTTTNGARKYTVHVLPKDTTLCAGDPSVEYIVYKLPETTLALASPITTFCTDAAARSVITATPTPAVALPIGADSVGYAYTWSATLGGVAVTNIATIGSNTTNANQFVVNAGIDVGAYVFTATATYASTIPIRPAASCPFTATQSITVSAKPAKPTITVLP